MKKIILILLFLSFSLFSQENILPSYMHLDFDLQAGLGNGVGQKDGPPYFGGGLTFHSKINFDIWETEKATSALSTGFYLSYLGDINSTINSIDERSGTNAVLKYRVDENVISINFSLGGTFYFLKDKNLFLGLYGIFGYAWSIMENELIENQNSYLSFENSPTKIFSKYGTSNVNFLVDFGYMFHKNVGIVASGLYIIPINTGITGNFKFSLGLRMSLN